MRIALWNASGLNNLGDRLLDHVNRRELTKRIPSASFQTFSPWACRSLPMVVIDSRGRWNYEGKFDAIVIGGGALLVGPPFIHPSFQTCYLGPYPDRFHDSCPVLWNAVCCNGEFVSLLAEPWRHYIRSAAFRLTYRSVRNRATADLFLGCGVEQSVDVVPDPVFLLTAGCPGRRQGLRRHLRVGIAVGSSSNSLCFMYGLRQASSQVWNPEVRVKFPRGAISAHRASCCSNLVRLVRCFKGSTRLRRRSSFEVCGFGVVYGDEGVAATLASELACQRVRHQSPLGTDLIAWIKSLDCLITSRLHACVLALSVGTPFVALDPYYSPVAETSKIRELMNDSGLLGSYSPLEELLGGDCEKIDALVQNAVEAASALPDIHEAYRKRLERHFDGLANVICA